MQEYNFNKNADESELLHLIRVSVDKLNGLHNTSWEEIHSSFKPEYSCYTLRRYAPAWKLLIDNRDVKGINEILEGSNYKESFEIKNDGSQVSDKLIVINETDSKTPEFMLEAHGYDPKEWELVNSRNNIWNTNDKRNGVQTLYSSKITVRPLSNGFTIHDLVDVIQRDTKPVYTKINQLPVERESLLEIPLFDMHFGIGDLEYYTPVMEKIKNKIILGNYSHVLFIIGQDLLHNDNFKGMTSNGTSIDKVQMEKAWEDAEAFFGTLILTAIKHSQKVVVSYSGGNHDEALGWAFVRRLEALYPQASFDTKFKSKKAFVWNKIFIGYTHGDKGAARVIEAFTEEYREDLLRCTVRELHTGHLHAEKSKDKFGIMHRTLSTKAKTDDWHYDQNFMGAMKRFQLFEYSTDNLEAIYYV